RHADAIDDEYARAGTEAGGGDHVAYETEIERRHDDADQLAGAATRLHDGVHGRRAGLEHSIADISAEAVRADVDVRRHRIAKQELAIGVEDGDGLDDRDAAAQAAEEQLAVARVTRRIGPLRCCELDRAPRALQRAVEGGAERADVSERAALDLVLDVVTR